MGVCVCEGRGEVTECSGVALKQVRSDKVLGG